MLIDRGVNVEPMARWSNVGLTVFDTKVPLGWLFTCLLKYIT